MDSRLIRAALADDGELLTGLVEMDEAYVGGKRRAANRKGDDKPGPRGPVGKATVIGAVERGGRLKTKLINKLGKINDSTFRLRK